MAMSPEIRAEVCRLFHADHFTMNAIAEALGIHHDTVKAILRPERIEGSYVDRLSIVDPFLPAINEALRLYPRIRSTRLLQMIRERGYKGSVTTLRRKVLELRPRAMKAYLPLTMMAGEQAQVDWGHFGKIEIEGHMRKLSCFACVLSHSRMLFAAFTLDQTLESFLRCHVAAFNYYGGVARKMVYDNLKSVVLERIGRDIRFNPVHLEFAGHYRFKPEACSPRAGWEKGRIERCIRFIRDNFIVGRHFRDLDDANRQISAWLELANARPWPDDKKKSVNEVYTEEKERLLKLPENNFPTDHLRTVRSGKVPYVRFDLNDYSIPYEYVGRPVTLIASQEKIRIMDGDQLLAEHQRSYGSGKKVRNDRHFAGLLEERRVGATMNARERLIAQIPEAQAFFDLMTEFNLPAGEHVKKLLTLLDEYGRDAVAAAVAEAARKGMPRATTVAQIIHQQSERSNEPPKLPLILPDRQGIKDLTVTPHNLATYDDLAKEERDDDR